MIIHISGAPGSGKTTIGLYLKKHYKTKVIVKDLDDLLNIDGVEEFNNKSTRSPKDKFNSYRISSEI